MYVYSMGYYYITNVGGDGHGHVFITSEHNISNVEDALRIRDDAIANVLASNPKIANVTATSFNKVSE